MTGIPLSVLIARLEHELESARIYLDTASNAGRHLGNAQEIAAEIRRTQ